MERTDFFVERTDYFMERSDYWLERSDWEGWGQNMDQGFMDPHFGPGPWTTLMDRVHGHFFLINENWKKTEIEQK